MRNFFQIFTAAVLCLAFVSTSIAADQKHMFSGASSSELYFGSYDSQSFDPQFSINLGYAYDLRVWRTQLGFNVGTVVTAGPDFYTVLTGPIFNFNDDYNNAFFGGFRVGVSSVSYLNDSNEQFHYRASVGKRFRLADNIAWEPSLNMAHTPQSDFDPDYSLSLFAFSLFF